MGSTFRFIHCADLHLGSAVHCPGQEEAIWISLRKLIDQAMANRADAMFIAGDLYDSSTQSPATRHRLVTELSRFKGRVFIARGNHDSGATWDSSIPYPENVHEFPPEPESVIVDTPGGQFEAVGISFGSRLESRSLPNMLKGRGDMFTVACVHGDSSGDGAYSPFDPRSLSGKGVDYWALGHIHARQVISESPYMVYPGNIQGRDMGETGEKGAYLVTVTEGRVSECRFIPTQSFCFRELTADITSSDLRTAVSVLRGQCRRGDCLRITFRGSGVMDAMLRKEPEAVRKSIESDLGCTVSEIRVMTRPDSPPGPITEAVEARGRALADAPREEVMGILMSKTLMKNYRTYFESMSDEEFRDLVDRSTRLAASAMEGSR